MEVLGLYLKVKKPEWKDCGIEGLIEFSFGWG
jgi:hypothetical protein